MLILRTLLHEPPVFHTLQEHIELLEKLDKVAPYQK